MTHAGAAKALEERNRLAAPPRADGLRDRRQAGAHGGGRRHHRLQLRARRDGGARAVDGGRSSSADRRFPSSRTWTIRATNLNRDGRRKIFIDYLDIVGPYEPSTAPPAELPADFHLRPRRPDNTMRSARAARLRTWRGARTAGRQPNRSYSLC